jgi:hypothetical protein
MLRFGPDCCVAIEDSANGVRAARAARLPVIACPSSYLRRDDFSLADSVLSNLGEPDAPCRHIAGLALDKDYIDIDGLNAWLAKRLHPGLTGRADSDRAGRRAAGTGG